MKTRHGRTRADAKIDAQTHADARADPDARPPTPGHRTRMRQTPRLKIIRRALGLTQEEFARRFQIALGTMRDWEQRGPAGSDGAATLRAIAGDAAAGRCRS
ncbi:MAG TPA: XRE family transcriptional regulator [Acetobacteraceae bacterium]|jgi:putative transcriptional regulator|nr:XRE family transcriptional regulator [Acetobacteraceae bacterium]HTC10947.1 XRE family transcriptional regulator [Acetobacteraceae bacterium]